MGQPRANVSGIHAFRGCIFLNTEITIGAKILVADATGLGSSVLGSAPLAITSCLFVSIHSNPFSLMVSFA